MATKWQEAHPEYVAEYHKKYYQENKERGAEQARKWQKANPEKRVKRNRKAKLKRRLWGKPTYLNARFEGSASHHMEKLVVIYIPLWLHKSVYHDLERGINMLKINDLAMAWFEALEAKNE